MLSTRGSSLAGEKSLEWRLKVLVERAAKEIGASYAGLLFCEQDTIEPTIRVWYGRSTPASGIAAVAHWALSKGEPICLHAEGQPAGIMGCSVDESALPLICAPVVSDETGKGVLIMGLPESAAEQFSRSLPTVEFVAELVAALLENATLRGELVRTEEQVRKLVRDTLDAQEGERERICLEVHDGVTQTLASAFHYLQAIESTSPEDSPALKLLHRAAALVKQAIQESREVINSLQPATLRDLGLIATLRQEMRQLEKEMGWKVELQADTVRFPSDIEIGFYRIIHEAITNARKHADTHRLRVTVTCVEDRAKVEIEDWGRGFSYNVQDMWTTQGTGLLSMRKRAELLQGACEIRTSPGHGTTVSVEVPLGRD